MRTFDAALAEAVAGRPAIIIVGGEAGAGKSRLISEFAARVRSAGGRAAIGYPTLLAEPGIPYAAIAHVLGSLVRGIDAREIETVLGPAAHDVAVLVPELGRPIPADAGRSRRLERATDPFGQARLLEAFLIVVERIAQREGPLLVALEDLHWMDTSSRTALAHLCRSLVGAPVVLAATYRSDAVLSSNTLAAFLSELDRLPGIERLELQPLRPSEVEAQLAHIAGTTLPAEVVRAIVERADGNPFFVEELAIAGLDATSTSLPRSVEAMVAARLAGLSMLARELVDLVAVAGASVPVRLVAAVTGATGMNDGPVPEALGEGLAKYLLVSSRVGGEEHVDVRHVLVREAIVSQLVPGDRPRLHAAIAAELERDPRLAGGSEVEAAATLGRHLLGAGTGRRAIPALLVVAGAAERARAFTEADHTFETILANWPHDAPEPPGVTLERWQIQDRAADAAWLAGRLSRATRLLELSLLEAEARQTVDDERPARLRARLGRVLAETGSFDAAIEAQVAALDGVAYGSPARLRILIGLARTQMLATRYAQAVESIADAVALARELGARREESEAWSVKAAALAMMGRSSQAVDALAQARRVEPLDATPSPSQLGASRLPGTLGAYLDSAAALERVGDLDQAAEVAFAGASAADGLGLADTWGQALAAAAARVHFKLGHWAEADRLTAKAGHMDLGAPLEAHLVRAMLEGARGHWDAAERHLALVGPGARSMAHGAGWAGLAALVAADHGCNRRRFEEARQAVRRGFIETDDAGEPSTTAELAALGLRIEADAAGSARARRASRELAACQESGIQMWARLAVVAGQAADLSVLDPRSAACLATGTGEMRRLQGLADPATWTSAVNAWDSAGDPVRCSPGSFSSG